MVVRFRGMPLMADRLKRQVNMLIANWFGSDGAYEGGVFHTAFDVRQHFYVLPNGDLYIDDEYDEMITGMLLQGLRAHSYLVEDAEIIVPRIYPDSDGETARLCNENGHSSTDTKESQGTAQEESIISFEEYLPDSAFDDGHFEEEMDVIAHMEWDDDE